MPRSRRPRSADVVGTGLVAALSAWVVVSAAANDGSRPWPTLLALAAATAAFVGGRAARRLLARDPSTTTVTLAVLAGAVVAFASALDVRASGGGPLGYGNANGALFAQLAYAVTLVRVAVPAPTKSFREVAAVLVLACATAAVLTGSIGATVAAAVGVVVTGGGTLARVRFVGAALAAPVVVAATGVVLAIAVGAGPVVLEDDSYGTRVQLWRGAVTVIEDHRATGAGPGRFEAVNPVSDDGDLRRAHSMPLQAAAELGLPGLALVFALGGWVVGSLWAVRDEATAVVGAASFTTIGVQSAFDWMLAEPVVLLVTAMVLGAASTSFTAPPDRLPRRLPGSRGSRRLRR